MSFIDLLLDAADADNAEECVKLIDTNINAENVN